MDKCGWEVGRLNWTFYKLCVPFVCPYVLKILAEVVQGLCVHVFMCVSTVTVFPPPPPPSVLQIMDVWLGLVRVERDHFINFRIYFFDFKELEVKVTYLLVI